MLLTGDDSAALRSQRGGAFLEFKTEVAHFSVKRFEARVERLEARVERLDARIERFDAHFERLDARFERLDAHFERPDARFERLDARFETAYTALDSLETQCRLSAELGGFSSMLDAFHREYVEKVKDFCELAFNRHVPSVRTIRFGIGRCGTARPSRQKARATSRTTQLREIASPEVGIKADDTTCSVI